MLKKRKADIQTREDIEFLVDTFYRQALSDKTIGHFFTEVVQLDWGQHLPKMYDFWETVVFSVVRYKGNPMLKHLELSRKSPLEPSHFARWMELWEATVHAHFEGENAQVAVQRASQIAELMKYKVQTVI